MPTPSERSAPPVPLAKKIFISYSRRDTPWVNSYLKCLLNAADVGFTIDEDDFVIGEPLQESIQKAIKESPYTLFVMTPDWVRGKWTHYESLLALEPDSDAVGRRILPIKLRNCEVPAHISPRLYLDLCEARRRDKLIVKLLQQIGVSEEGIAKALNSVAKKTLLLLIELMEEPRVRDEVSKLRVLFVDIHRSNHVLATNKLLHDDLQDIQLALDQLLRDIELQGTDLVNWQRMWGGMSALCQQLEKLLNHAAAVADDRVDMAFIEDFKEMPEELNKAFQNRDARRFSSHLTQLSRQLVRSLPRINERIVSHVQGQRLETLAQSLQTVYEIVAEGEDVIFDEATTALLDEFRSGIDALTEIDLSIRERVHDHSTLQDAEMDFQQMIRQGEPTLYDISLHWSRVKKWVAKLKLAERYERLLQTFDQLCEQLSDDSSVRDGQYEDGVRWNFKSFVHETRTAFNKLDIDLLAICNKLAPHGAELQQILNRMQTYDEQFQ